MSLRAQREGSSKSFARAGSRAGILRASEQAKQSNCRFARSGSCVYQLGSVRLRRTDGGDAITLLWREQIRIAAKQ